MAARVFVDVLWRLDPPWEGHHRCEPTRSASCSHTTDGRPAGVLALLDGLDPAVWTRTGIVDERGLGGILVHHLGASQRWRIGFESQSTDEGPEPELEPLPTIDELRERWEAEWAAVDAWLPTLTDDFIEYVHEGVPVWQMLVHVVNHGTQHRAEGATLLTAEGRSPASST